MRRLKEMVKSGEITPSVALTLLHDAARRNGDVPFIYRTKTWKWLKRREKEAEAAS